MKFISSFVLVSASLLASFAYAEEAKTSAKEPTKQEQASNAKTVTDISGLSNDTIVATINDHKVYKRDLVAMQQSLPPIAGVDINQIYNGLLNQYVQEYLVGQEGKKLGLEKSKDVQAALDYANNTVYRDEYVKKIIDKATSKEALKKLYNERTAEMKNQDEVHARHILVDDEKQADKVYAEVTKKGASFEGLASEYSKDPSGARGGDLGYFTADKMVKPFADAAFALKKGEISKPVKSQFGWHIIKVEDRRKAEIPSYDEMYPDLHREAAEKAIGEKIEGLKKQAKVNILIKGEPPKAPEQPKKIKQEAEKSSDKEKSEGDKPKS